MTRNATPMFHVPDVAATAAWYASIGFDIVRTVEDDGETVWARLAWGAGQFMLNAGGKPSDAVRREADLYVEVDDVEGLRRALDGRVEIVEDLHDTYYGMREFIIRDPNRFWITFGQPPAGA